MQSLPRNHSVSWASPPSDTILRLVKVKGIDLSLLRAKLGLNINDFIKFLHDRLLPGDKLIFELSQCLGSNESFWKNRYQDYFQDVEHSNQFILEKYKRQLSDLSQVRNVSVSDLLDSFMTTNYEKIVVEYFENPKILYSRDNRFEPSPALIANWIRKCEQVAERVLLTMESHRFSSDLLRSVLPHLLELTKVNSIQKVENKLRDTLLMAGVVIVFSPNQDGHGVSGLTKSILKQYKLVVVTDRYKNNAAFWFTLFHELSHCVLHDVNRSLIHYSDEMFTLSSLPSNYSFEEDEANRFAESSIFQNQLLDLLNKGTIRSHNEVIRLGVKFDISPSLILAYLHRNKLVPYSNLRKIYRKVEFDDIH